jgi:hypothetical protein
MKKPDGEALLTVRPRETETVTLAIPKDTLASVRQVAAQRDMSEQALLKFYIGQGLRQDLARRFGDRVLACMRRPTWRRPPTQVGYSADSPEPLLRSSPTMVRAPEMLVLYDPHGGLCRQANKETFPHLREFGGRRWHGVWFRGHMRFTAGRNEIGLTDRQIAYCVEAWAVLCADKPIAFDTSEAVLYAARTRFSEVQNTVLLGADVLPGDGGDAQDREDLVEDARDRLIQWLALPQHEGETDAHS